MTVAAGGRTVKSSLGRLCFITCAPEAQEPSAGCVSRSLYSHKSALHGKSVWTHEFCAACGTYGSVMALRMVCGGPKVTNEA